MCWLTQQGLENHLCLERHPHVCIHTRYRPSGQVLTLTSLSTGESWIADCIETLRGTDFYRPAHESVYDAITDLYARGEPADAITVAAELTKRGEMARIGGAPYVHTLVASVPLAANASYYAHIVREKAILRRLVEAGTKIVQLGYAGEGEVDDVVDEAQAEIYQVTEKRTTEDYAPLKDIMEGALDEIEAIDSRGDAMVGVPTGFTDLDELTNGLPKLHAWSRVGVLSWPEEAGQGDRQRAVVRRDADHRPSVRRPPDSGLTALS
ncbi:DnaB-like helicase N-terminal domain-containing protein [Kribbella sp. ALI-6-A]|uniref:replicative DNA helicase n=1 Tax=Kribbella sp. ALI-6-A TaxID=1933817 RepID=UPI001EDB5747